MPGPLRLVAPTVSPGSELVKTTLLKQLAGTRVFWPLILWKVKTSAVTCEVDAPSAGIDVGLSDSVMCLPNPKAGATAWPTPVVARVPGDEEPCSRSAAVVALLAASAAGAPVASSAVPATPADIAAPALTNLPIGPEYRQVCCVWTVTVMIQSGRLRQHNCMGAKLGDEHGSGWPWSGGLDLSTMS